MTARPGNGRARGTLVNIYYGKDNQIMRLNMMPHYHRLRCLTLWLLAFLLLCCIALTIALTDADALKEKGNAPTARQQALLSHFLQARCGTKGAIWVYEGALYDPLTGNHIAAVEGLELIKRSSGSNNNTNTNTNTNKQVVERAHDAHTILTRRLFCYKAPAAAAAAASGGTAGLLRDIRSRPTSPLRRIPVDQAVSAYDSTTTYIQPQTRTGKAPKQWLVHTEWPNNQKSIWSKAVLSPGTSSNNSYDDGDGQQQVEFTIYARPRSKLKNARLAPDLVAAALDDGDEQQTITTSPARTALVQFGASSQEQQQQPGARETYQYTFTKRPPERRPAKRQWFSRLTSPKKKPFLQQDQNDGIDDNDNSQQQCRVRYTRHGEGPVWYGPGRMCTLELTGRRVPSVAHIPAFLTSVATNHVPGFVMTTTTTNGDEEAEQWLHRDAWQVVNGEEQVELGLFSWKSKQAAATSLWQRIRGAMSFQQQQ
jgi:hypothetical protein